MTGSNLKKYVIPSSMSPITSYTFYVKVSNPDINAYSDLHTYTVRCMATSISITEAATPPQDVQTGLTFTHRGLTLSNTDCPVTSIMVSDSSSSISASSLLTPTCNLASLSCTTAVATPTLN